MRAISVARVVLAEVAEAEGVEVPFVSWITEGAEIGIVRGHYGDCPSRAYEAVELLHGFHDVADVFDHMDGAQFVERLVAEGVGEQVEVGDDVGAGTGIAVESDGAGVFVDPTADV